MVNPSIQVPMHCPRCSAEDLNNPGIPVTDGGRVVTRVIWQGLSPHPSGQGMIPVLNLDIAAGMVPNRMEFPQVARWQPSQSYCPNCKVLLYCGPDWQQLQEDANSPQILVPE